MYILSHPLRGNYGGMLQGYALQRALSNLGISSVYINLTPELIEHASNSTGKLSLWQKTKLCIHRLLIFAGIRIDYTRHKTKNICDFKKLFTSVIDVKIHDLKSLAQENSKPWIVGSDQVWRPSYVRPYGGIKYFFLSFLPVSSLQRSIAYAASFGTEEWDGSRDETLMGVSCLSQFKAVSVRELSGTKLCFEKFNVDAVRVPDPTFLLENDDYEQVIKSAPCKTLIKDALAVYLLDREEKYIDDIKDLAKKLDMKLQWFVFQRNKKKPWQYLSVSVPQWLKIIRDCRYLVTDSFHGCVFAIIFNKPFVCLGNTLRGNTRFDSLLSIYGLESRMVSSGCFDDILRIMREPIDWMKVNAIRESERKMGIEFLKNNLT